MKYFWTCLLLACWGAAGAVPPGYYQLRVYRVTQAQLPGLEKFMADAFVPALHRAGIPSVGVFIPVSPDTGTLYVLIPFKTPDAWQKLDKTLAKDEAFARDGRDILQAPFDHPPYLRMESILLRAFPDMPAPAVPDLKAPKSERVYELRSYESATEALHENKVRMFNEGGEVTLFKRLGFNAVFYADVLSGSHEPNLMYMTTFENKADRDQHWNTFSNDPEWKKLVSSTEYQHNVSKADIIFLRPEAFSDF
ncbi:NIPSNAP family protein [Dinghuibacter silviterrae]|uniref:NIPSNAP protein n=1 Tax=Dinghuibacter silviterrae TaxID=1539049 RepID=A0A4R8DEL6_9BACT|nr:NIPSNAP family protein [Dinghuibacter silviterrae]TDW95981.1 NIPSNAP protein [Dinghuibacter silviterrae]